MLSSDLKKQKKKKTKKVPFFKVMIVSMLVATYQLLGTA
jgi:hypothetical protein